MNDRQGINEQRATLEVIAPSVDEAIEKGLAELELSRESVKIEILDEGTRGILGIGSRQARVRLMVIDRIEPEVKEDVQREVKPGESMMSSDAIIMEHEEELEEDFQEAQFSENEHVIQIVQETVSDLLEKMGVDAEINTYLGEPDENRNIRPIHVDIEGDDLSILIGKRSETLNALQYVTRLIVGKELQRSVLVVIDVEGYRKRRERSLRQLAQRMAEQAIKTGRRQILEPMPPNERRIIHIELRPNTQVETESRGEEPYRKVTIYPVE
jgi:spoIIIJ-associated protein